MACGMRQAQHRMNRSAHAQDEQVRTRLVISHHHRHRSPSRAVPTAGSHPCATQLFVHLPHVCQRGEEGVGGVLCLQRQHLQRSSVQPAGQPLVRAGAAANQGELAAVRFGRCGTKAVVACAGAPVLERGFRSVAVLVVARSSSGKGRPFEAPAKAGLLSAAVVVARPAHVAHANSGSGIPDPHLYASRSHPDDAWPRYHRGLA